MLAFLDPFAAICNLAAILNYFAWLHILVFYA